VTVDDLISRSEADLNSGCWLWARSNDGKGSGYGSLLFNGRQIITPFRRDQSVNGHGCSAVGTVPAAPAPKLAAGTTSFPEALEPLAASHFSDLQTGSVYRGLADLIDAALADRDKHFDNRTNGFKAPAGAIADSLVDRLMDAREALHVTMLGEARKGALAEARELDAEYSAMTQAEVEVELPFLRPCQRAALLWAQAEAIAAASSLTRAIGEAGQ
jgi:hypothetical protein